MMIGSVFMLMMSGKRLSDGQIQKLKFWKQFQTDAIKDINKASFIVYERLPLGLWTFGFLLSVMSIIVTGLLLLHKHIFLDEIDGFSYFIFQTVCVCAFICGFILLFIAKKEKFRINKNEDLIYVEYKNIFFRQNLEGRFLHSLKEFSIVKKGIQTFTENTIHYVIRFQFNDGFDDLEVAESRKFADIKKKYIQISTYLDKDLYSQQCSIQFFDESTVTFRWKQKKDQKKAVKKPPQLQQNKTISSTSLDPEIIKRQTQPKSQSLFTRLRVVKHFIVNDD